jgi:hypothetical protein
MNEMFSSEVVGKVNESLSKERRSSFSKMRGSCPVKPKLPLLGSKLLNSNGLGLASGIKLDSIEFAGEICFGSQFC